ncbi:Histidine kinase-like ATPase domain-containing protein [Streptomyces sp. WMMB 714]|nr:Histidine kinase-like ATPase domain-containing protein [Streptomyces sp. WMMB 714]
MLEPTTAQGGESSSCPRLATFSMQFPSSPRGARLARQLAVKRLAEWGHEGDSELSCSVALLVGELAANAVSHGRVPGRDFLLRLAHLAEGTVRVEVSDADALRLPVRPAAPSCDDESGRGLLLVETLATRWGTRARHPVGKTVWAEVVREVPRPRGQEAPPGLG